MLWITYAVGNNYGKLTGHPSEEHILFRSGIITGSPSGDTHVSFEVVNGSLHGRSYFIEVILSFGL